MTYFVELTYRNFTSNMSMRSDTFDNGFYSLQRKLRGTRFCNGETLYVPLDFIWEGAIDALVSQLMSGGVVRIYCTKLNSEIQLSHGSLKPTTEAAIYSEFSSKFNYRPKFYSSGTTSNSTAGITGYAGVGSDRVKLPPPYDRVEEKKKKVKEDEIEKLDNSLFETNVMKLNQDE